MNEFKFGAFDPLYPNGLLSAANAENLLGFRLITRGTDGRLYAGRTLDAREMRIGPIDGDRLFELSWQAGAGRASLRWGRIDEARVYGEVSMDAGLSVALELYVPREYRLLNRWVNFTQQAPRVLAGELITPFEQPPANAARLILSEAPLECEGYNQREAELEHLEREGCLVNVAPGNIWGDMGVSWYRAARFERGFSFVYQVGDPEEFLDLPDGGEIDRQLKEGRQLLDANRARFQEGRLRGEGALAGIPDAVQTPIEFNTMYRDDTRRRFVMVDRPWARSDDDWGITFNWDTFLSSLSASWFDTALARENLLCGYDMQLPDGRIPLTFRVRQGHSAEPPIMAGRGQHIVQGYCAWQTYLWSRDKQWLMKVYPKIQRSHAWWLGDRGDGKPWRDGLNQGLIGFGYDPANEMGVLGARVQPYVAKAQYAYFETYDDSPQWTDGVFFKTVKGLEGVTEDDVTDKAKYVDALGTVDMYTLERCCLYALEAECLANMAGELGWDEERERCLAEHDQMARRVNERMWDEQDGCYYNLHFDGRLSKVQTPDCFMPIMAGIAPPERVERLMRLLKDETKFWGGYCMPSVARDDPAYPDQKYWRGQIWPPQVLWTYLSLRRSGRLEEAWMLAQCASGMLVREWSERNFCPENYNGDTGRCSGSPHYNWGTLMGVIALNELVELTPETVTFGRTRAPEGTALHNIRLDGHLYGVELKQGKVRVLRDGALLAEQSGPVTVARS